MTTPALEPQRTRNPADDAAEPARSDATRKAIELLNTLCSPEFRTASVARAAQSTADAGEVVVSGELLTIRIGPSAVEPSPTAGTKRPSVVDMLRRAYAAGGKAWDDVSDPAKFIDEVFAP